MLVAASGETAKTMPLQRRDDRLQALGLGSRDWFISRHRPVREQPGRLDLTSPAGPWQRESPFRPDALTLDVRRLGYGEVDVFMRFTASVILPCIHRIDGRVMFRRCHDR